MSDEMQNGAPMGAPAEGGDTQQDASPAADAPAEGGDTQQDAPAA